MITDVLPQSPSVLLRATCVVRLVITAVHPGPWQVATEGISRRRVEVDARIEEVFKGDGAGQKLVLQLEQHRNDGFVYVPVPGAWSEQVLEKGRELIVAGIGVSLKAALEEPEQVLPAEAVDEVRLVAMAEEKRLQAAAVAQQAKPIAKRLDFVFARWLWERHGERALVDPGAADAVFSLLELPELGDSARAMLVVEAVGRAASAQSTYIAGTRRLTRALFRLLALPEAKGLSENIVRIDLPALLRLRDPPPVPRRFLLDDLERDEARKALRAYSGTADAKPLAAWLDGP